VADCIPEPNLRRFLVDLHVEGEPLRLAASRHHLVHLGHRGLLCCYRSSRRIRSENQVVGECFPPCGSRHVGINMQVTEVRIRPASENLVKAYASICFDDCFLVYDIKVIQGPTGLFVSFPAKKLSDGTHRQLAYPANAETRMMIRRAILAEYEKVVAESDGKADAK
jgi:stage V sporulation protein G